jgi:hypothetical protein
MQFFFLLLFNIFLGAVLYLVISLKLERSATEYRSRKLRKEMDEMISEFNATAERNISLLERKIRVMRLLLEKAGDLKSLDLTAFGEEDPAPKETGAAEAREDAAPRALPGRGTVPGAADQASLPAERNNAGSFIKKGLLIFIEKINNMLQTGQAGVPAGEEHVDRQWSAAADDAYSDPDADRRHLIEKDLSGVVSEADAAGSEPEPAISEDEIREIIESSPDMYAVVSVLSKKGCAPEEISRYSGIPVGEVRLVMNLNGSR